MLCRIRREMRTQSTLLWRFRFLRKNPGMYVGTIHGERISKGATKSLRYRSKLGMDS